MPKIFLSPSTQEFNPYTGEQGGNEEYYMNLIADAMEPYLSATGIEFVRNDPNGTVRDSVAKSNMDRYDLHLALHSNASPENIAGTLKGSDFYYYTRSKRGKDAIQHRQHHARRRVGDQRQQQDDHRCRNRAHASGKAQPQLIVNKAR